MSKPSFIGFLSQPHLMCCGAQRRGSSAMRRRRWNDLCCQDRGKTLTRQRLTNVLKRLESLQMLKSSQVTCTKLLIFFGISSKYNQISHSIPILGSLHIQSNQSNLSNQLKQIETLISGPCLAICRRLLWRPGWRGDEVQQDRGRLTNFTCVHSVRMPSHMCFTQPQYPQHPTYYIICIDVCIYIYTVYIYIHIT